MASSGVATSSKSIFGFDPRTVPGCQLWLDAADLATLSFSSGNIISTWKDKSINGVVLTAYGNPTTTTVNGRTSISLNGSTQYLQKADFTPTKGATYMSWFAVANVTNYANANYACIVGTAYNSQWSQNTLFVKTGTGLIFYRSADQTASKELSSGAVTTNTLFQTETDYVSGQYQINLNGAGLFSKTDGVTGAIDTLTVNLQVGWDSFSGDSYVAGTISECLLFTSPVSPANKRAIEGYLAWKWGLQNSLVNAISLTPLSISGCSIWLDASDTTTVFQNTAGTTASTNGTKVALWKDKSGNNRNATQITSAATNPTYTTGQQNGLPGIYFNSSGLNLPTLNLSPITIFLVAKSTTYTYGNIFISFTSGTGIYLRSTDGSVAPTYSSYGVDYGSAAYRYTTQVANTDTNTHLWSFSLPSSGFGQFLFDGVDGTTSTGFTASQIGASSSSISIGCYGQLPTNNPLNGYINEIIIYNSALRKSQIRQIELYLSFKWGITTSKSNAHQYAQLIPYSRSFQPTDIPGCQLWLDAADQSTLTLINSGANASNWRDKSGNSYNCSTSSGANSPAYSSSTQGLQFRSASTQSLAINQLFGDALVNTTFTIFCVGQRVSTGQFNLFLAGSPLTAFQTLQIGFNSVNTINLNMYSAYYETTITSYAAGTEPINIYTYEVNTTNVALFLNGATVYNTAATPRLAAFTTPEIGRRYGGTGYQIYHDFNLFEMIAYTRSLTSGQRQQIEGYLAAKWRLQSSLGQHPFLKIPPTSPSLFSPTNIGACAIWIDGNDPNGTGVVPASGATFATTSATIIDKSGNGYNLTPTATINYSTQFLNNMGVLNFGSARAQNSSFNWTTNFTQFVVVKGDAGTWGTSYISTADVFWAYITATNNSTNLVNILRVGTSYGVYDATVTNQSIFTNTGNGLTAWTIFCIGYTAGSTSVVNYTLNGKVWTSGTATSFNSSQATNLVLTLNGNRGGNYDTGVYVAEFIHYNATLSTNQRQQVEGYLAGKWGLQGLLPTTHPYYKSIPAAVSSYYFYESFEVPANLAATLNAPNAWGYSPAWNEWTVTGVSKSGVGSPWDPAGGTAAAGSWYAYMQGNGSTASRVFQGPIGYTATLSFSYGYRVSTSLVTSVSVTWTPTGGSAVALPGSPFAMPSSATPWTTVTTSFVFTASSGTLIFMTNAPGQPDPSALIDNILIT